MGCTPAHPHHALGVHCGHFRSLCPGPPQRLRVFLNPQSHVPGALAPVLHTQHRRTKKETHNPDKQKWRGHMSVHTAVACVVGGAMMVAAAPLQLQHLLGRVGYSRDCSKLPRAAAREPAACPAGDTCAPAGIWRRQRRRRRRRQLSPPATSCRCRPGSLLATGQTPACGGCSTLAPHGTRRRKLLTSAASRRRGHCIVAVPAAPALKECAPFVGSGWPGSAFKVAADARLGSHSAHDVFCRTGSYSCRHPPTTVPQSAMAKSTISTPPSTFSSHPIALGSSCTR